MRFNRRRLERKGCRRKRLGDGVKFGSRGVQLRSDIELGSNELGVGGELGIKLGRRLQWWVKVE